MDFMPQFQGHQHHHAPTTTISIDPPGGTGHPGPHHTDHLPLPTGTFPTPHIRFLHATNPGHTALWVVFAIFTVGLIGVLVIAQRVEKRARLFHWLSALVLTIAMVSYLAMATGLGITYVPIHAAKEASNYIYYRQVYYARYIDWLFTTPLLLVSLAVLAGLSPSDTVLVILFDVFMIVTGLLGGSVSTRYTSGERARWAFFAVSCVGFLAIWWVLLTGGMKAANQRPRKTKGLFVLLGGMTLILWSAYPIVFALTEGTNKLSVNTEIIAYAVLDVAAKVGFTYLLLFLHGHGDDSTIILPEWFIEHRSGSGADSRGAYGSLGTRDE